MAGRLGSTLLSIMSAAAMIALPISTARAADLVAPGPYVVAAPSSYCLDDRPLARIQRGFAVQAREVHHDPGLYIAEISNIRENRYEPANAELIGVDRLYCRATAVTSDGQARTLWYMIEYGAGFAGMFGDNVEFCLSGLDTWNVYDAYCRVLR